MSVKFKRSQDFIIKEYESLRVEILEWQKRRLIVYNIALIISFTYTTWIIGVNVKDMPISFKNWKILSLIPLLILSATTHMHRLFEFYQLKVVSYINATYSSSWEMLHDKIEEEIKPGRYFGLNFTYALVFFCVGLSISLVFYLNFPKPMIDLSLDFGCLDLSLFIGVSIYFLYNIIKLGMFNFSKKKKEMIEAWEARLNQ